MGRRRKEVGVLKVNIRTEKEGMCNKKKKEKKKEWKERMNSRMDRQRGKRWR